jgi:hypothetical protein
MSGAGTNHPSGAEEFSMFGVLIIKKSKGPKKLIRR